MGSAAAIHLTALAIFLLPELGYANGILGSTTNSDRLSESYQLQLSVEAQKSWNNPRRFYDNSATISGVGGLNGSATVSDLGNTVAAELVMLRGEWTVKQGISVFAKLGEVQEVGDKFIQGDASFAGSVGLRFSPVLNSPIKVGATMQGTYFDSRGQRDNAYVWANTTSGFFSGAGVSQDKLTSRKLDILMDVSVDTNYVRPYVGILFSYLQGEYSSSMDVKSYTLCTPSCTTGGPASFTEQRKIKGIGTIGAVLGIAFNPREPIGFNLEGHFIQKTEQSFTGSVVVRF